MATAACSRLPAPAISGRSKICKTVFENRRNRVNRKLFDSRRLHNLELGIIQLSMERHSLFLSKTT